MNEITFRVFSTEKKIDPGFIEKLVNFTEEDGYNVMIENSTNRSSMQTIPMKTWEEFEERANKIVSDIRKDRDKTFTPLFRGHSKESWPLKTTLERYSVEVFSQRGYYRVIKNIKPTIESLTAHCYNLPEFYERVFFQPAGYEFMIYLRHHGFPSPLLDWTQSPYIAAFFAFEDNRKRNENEKKVAIFYFQEPDIPGGEGDSTIYRVGPSVQTHERHFLQQAEYTICTTEVGNGQDQYYQYSNHEDVIADNKCKYGAIEKYTIPFSEREKVMRKLDLMNINAHSLFNNQEGLMKTLAFRELVR